ncbi:MAG: HAMP domain-containing histidine kinase [Lachnospiraceae bacterium]|nr:HAMP domain-containing histidine kinase [Lachnospiraceae bacterium]
MKLKKKMINVVIFLVLQPVLLLILFVIISKYLHVHLNIMYLLIPMIIAMSVTTTFFIHSFNKYILAPIHSLNDAMERIADGDLDFSVRTEGTDEISTLLNNFDDMREILKVSAEEKIRYDNENRELISNISHDLKTPITSIKGYVEGIMDGVADNPEKMDRYIKTIYNKTNEMDRLLNELTLYSQIDTNRIPYNFHRINVSDFFSDCVEELGLELESKNITLNYTNELPLDTRIIADPEQLRRVISNIIGNSIKYMGKPTGSINISILDNNDSVKIEISDTGKGISQKDIPHIFDRFYRADTSRNSRQGGSGIGLSIVKKVIEDHGGYIWASSTEGEGTTIHFIIRKYQEEGQNEQNIDS